MNQNREDTRPDPDALLTRAEAEEPQRRVGRLKIFFGASPGGQNGFPSGELSGLSGVGR